jgi:hypothetical protein
MEHNMTEAYPLYFPEGRPRTKNPQRSRFSVLPHVARDGLFSELKALGAKNIIVSTNVKLRQDGLPYAGLKEPEDKGVAVYFTYKGSPVCFACDRWDRIHDNMQAIRHTIEALRGIARWGTGDMVQAAFKGFEALPAPKKRTWRDVLGVKEGAPMSEVLTAYRSKAREAHPDNGGSHETMSELNAAMEQARKWNEEKTNADD